MTKFHSLKKSGLIAAFFFILLARIGFAADLSETAPEPIANRLIEAAAKMQLHREAIWSSLLHVVNGRPSISDPDFILSSSAFSLENELRQTIIFLYQGTPENVCRFPARYFWLKGMLDAPTLPVDACPDIVEFRLKAPSDEISLVFASENLSQPASMLGHTFLKISGKNVVGNETSHAVSFYTDTDTINIPKLLYDSIVTGKHGYFTLSPYAEKIELYVDSEQRSLWEYRLLLNNTQKELIILHLLELKNVKLSYFFQKYNCATVINFIICLSRNTDLHNNAWITPKDVIKNAQQLGLISETRVVTPSRWLVRALEEQISKPEKKNIQQQIEDGAINFGSVSPGNDQTFLHLELAKAYNQYAYQQNKISETIWVENNQELSATINTVYPNKILNGNNSFNPLNTPDDSQIVIAGIIDDDRPLLGLTFLPVSHMLSDDNHAYASETELELFATTLHVPLQAGTPRLERFDLYDIQSLLPRDSLTGGISGRFSVSYEPHYDNKLDKHQAVAVNGALGLTERITWDLDIYGLAGGGLAYGRHHGYGYLTAETGAIVREVWNMKSLLSYVFTMGQLKNSANYSTVRFRQSKYMDKAHSVQLEWEKIFDQDNTRNTLLLSFKKIF
jgi:hypothetical protein